MQPTSKAPNRILVDSERVRQWDNPNSVVVDAAAVSQRSAVDVEYVRADTYQSLNAEEFDKQVWMREYMREYRRGVRRRKAKSTPPQPIKGDEK